MKKENETSTKTETNLKETAPVTTTAPPKTEDAKVDDATAKKIEAAQKSLDKAKEAYEKAKKVLSGLNGKAPKAATGPGVIASILEFVEMSGEKGITKKVILTKLEKRFPDRAPESMSKTINVQLPIRMSRERKVNIVKNDDGRFLVKAAKVKKVA